MKRKWITIQKKRCWCGCGRFLKLPETGRHFATADCILQALEQAGFDEEHTSSVDFENAIRKIEQRAKIQQFSGGVLQ